MTLNRSSDHEIRRQALKIEWQNSEEAFSEMSQPQRNALDTYKELGWSVFSCDLGFNSEEKKKTLSFHSASWKDLNSPCVPNASGYGLRTGKVSNITAIDIDDPTLEHNKELIKMCEEAGGIRQNTKKGIHYLFAYTDALKQTTNKKLELDIRNDGGFLLIEPSSYKVRNTQYKYSIANLPQTKEAIPTCPQNIIDYIQKLYRPNLDSRENKTAKKMLKDRAKTMNSDMAKSKADISKREEDIRRLLSLIDKKHAEEYSDWIGVAIALCHAGLSWELFDEFSKRSEKYKEGEPFYVYMSLKKNPFEDVPFTLSSLYWWLKQENKEAFIELVMTEGEEDYSTMKEEFEKTTFIVGSKLLHLQSNGTHTFLTDSDANLMYANKLIKTYDKEKDKVIKEPFYKRWKFDENRKQYDRMDFLPRLDECPSDVYNCFKGLKGATYTMALSDQQIEELVEPVLYHLNMLTSDESDYVIKWLANMVQTPWRKAETTLLFRDMTRFLKSGGGTGKNVFVEWFGNTILGEDYFVVFGVNALLFDPFNELLENKLLVLIEEASGKDNGREDNTLKSNITSKTKQINRKFQPKYTQKDYTSYIFFSNEANPIPMAGSLGQRRIAAFDVDVRHKDDASYFNELCSHLEKPETSAAFYRWLMKQETYKSPVMFQTKRPTTPCICDLRRMNANLLLKWVIHKVELDEDIRGEVSVLFKEFMDWCVARNEKKTDDNTWSQTKFTRDLTNNSDIVLVRPGELYKSSNTFLRLNMNRLREDLVKNHYIFRDQGDVRYAFLEED
jgi:hypothetical protein